MKKILSPLMAAALVTGLSMGVSVRAEEGAADAQTTEAKPAKKGKGKAKGKGHAKKGKKDAGCGKDGSGCKKDAGCGKDGSGCGGHDHGDEKKE